MSRSIQEQVNKTYFSLRWAAAIIGYAFPLILWIGGHFAGFGLRDSMSAYYHAYYHSTTNNSLAANTAHCDQLSAEQLAAVAEAGSLRNEFVGLLFAIGSVLYVNKGHTNKENVLLNLAGVFACCIALFPMPWACEPSGPITPHGTFAILFFAAIASILLFCSKDTVDCLPKARRKTYYTWYYVLAGIMIASPLLAWAANESMLGKKSYTFGIEFFGIYAFGTYWIVKTREIRAIQKYQALVKVPRIRKVGVTEEVHEEAVPQTKFF
jgi:hypothetical protein